VGEKPVPYWRKGDGDIHRTPGVQARGMGWHQLPVIDIDIPCEPFDDARLQVGPIRCVHLVVERRLVSHYLGGPGPMSTVAARLLIEMGQMLDAAFRAARQVRPDALETHIQEAHDYAIQPLAADRRPIAPHVVEPGLRDRARGALLGLAVGDALGTTLEFSARDSLPRHSEMTGGGPFGLEPGQWTDDTSMALALAESLVAHPGFDADDLMQRFTAWHETGAYSCTGACFDIGVTTAQALRRYRRTGDPFAGSTDPQTAGNGSLMRLAPVALHCLHDAAAARRLAVDQSRTTHAAAQATEACAFFMNLLREAILGRCKADVLAPRRWQGDAAVQAIATGAWRGRPRDAIRSSGYVLHLRGSHKCGTTFSWT